MNNPFENAASKRPAETVAYDPNNLLDSLIENLRLKNDAALSRALEVAPPVISKIRHHRLPVGASLLIRMHEVSDLSIRELRVPDGRPPRQIPHQRQAVQAEERVRLRAHCNND